MKCDKKDCKYYNFSMEFNCEGTAMSGDQLSSVCKDYMIQELQQQIEDMKCCGCCVYYQSGSSCVECCHWNEVCPKWQSDSLTRKEREI
jgi:hypothetical protein